MLWFFTCTPKKGRVAEPGFNGHAPGKGEIMLAPVSVCHHVSTIGHLPSPTTPWYHSQALGSIASPPNPSTRRLALECFFIYCVQCKQLNASRCNVNNSNMISWFGGKFILVKLIELFHSGIIFFQISMSNPDLKNRLYLFIKRLQRSNHRWCCVEDCHFVFLNDLPPPAWIWICRYLKCLKSQGSSYYLLSPFNCYVILLLFIHFRWMFYAVRLPQGFFFIPLQRQQLSHHSAEGHKPYTYDLRSSHSHLCTWSKNHWKYQYSKVSFWHKNMEEWKQSLPKTLK